jgi:D-alanyl-D-alanine carboxypeptidase/D-alanyl-D-alanine-endopeptidase (penicillin-binding protein 4)
MTRSKSAPIKGCERLLVYSGMREATRRGRTKAGWRGLTWLVAGSVIAALALMTADASRGRISLVWHIESSGGESLDSSRADESINPASIVKVATSLWALERLGPRHRFETIVGVRGEIDDDSGVLNGDLIVVGGADPDFHVENAFLVARALNEAGITTVSGRLVVVGDFWIGWEGGSEGTLADPDRRAQRMALRLRDALDPRRWNRGTRREWTRFAGRREIPITPKPRVVVLDGVDTSSEPVPFTSLLVHQSNELVNALKRFNTYSNNDIERLGASLGTPQDLAKFLVERWDVPANGTRIETLSGLGTNRMTPREIVRLMHDMRDTCGRVGIQVEDVLPVAGCDPGTMRAFSRLASGPASKVLTGKTGTLTYTDDGITALAGYVHTTEGELIFCVAAPRSSGRISSARYAEESWLLDRIKDHGGPQSRTCGLSPWHSDADAKVVERRNRGRS